MTQREIIFRGKRIPDGLWLYGSLDNRESEFVNIRPSKKEFVLEEVWMARQVDPATVGQYTGLKDKHGEKIFEGDKVKCSGQTKTRILTGKKVHSPSYKILEIGSKNGSFVYRVVDQQNSHFGELPSNWSTVYHMNFGKYFEIIGNIHEEGTL